MKRIGTCILAAWLLTAACRSVPKGDTSYVTAPVPVATAAAGDVYRSDPGQTRIEWIGASPVRRHHGTFTLREGQFQFYEGAITCGRFVIDMASLRADDADSINNTRLGNHLKSIDFFDVARFPLAIFELTGVQPIV